ncbi:carcinoembryonic antigen-related cell adhesion molecule 5-like [Thunnus maccoyii]|uniref:carcinoembryonic antigen-related cell adhesion molecule 5-like n=1 Tax=Thunnus maccoyii TaxID=8240 RepID=UPI001C4A84E8|nr:carcinoembryonic antigen-related cell adhesion molecule 5-like [Thunnus maccoyii]
MTFTTTVTPPGTPFLAVTWSFVDIHGSNINIVTSTQVNITGVAYTDRVTLFRSTGSLELKNLTLNDTGEYTVTVIPSGGAQLRGNCRLVIHAPVSNVNVTSNTTDLMEFSSSVNLSCSSSGSSLTFLWLNSSSEVVASERVQLIGGGHTLTIVNVTRYDQGPYRCHVFNPVSNGTSDPVNLSIIFGPDNINLTKSPSQEYYDEGSDITLMCSAASSPSALFQWFLDGHMLSDTGPVFRLMNIHMSQSGNYSCQAFNNKTLNHQTSQPAAISVLKSPISNVVITPNTTDLVEFSSSVNGPENINLKLSPLQEFYEKGSNIMLSCSAASRPSAQFHWFLNGGLLSHTGPELTLMNIQESQSGNYSCQAFNNRTMDLTV